jgi:hypothetical protein
MESLKQEVNFCHKCFKVLSDDNETNFCDDNKRFCIKEYYAEEARENRNVYEHLACR